MTGEMQRPEAKNPGREGGPLGFQHTDRGIVPIDDYGLPLIDDEHPELDAAADPAALDRYPVIDIEAVLVTDTESGHSGS